MLLKSTEDIKAVLGALQANMSFETLEPYVDQAELTYIVPVIGVDLYNELQSGFDDSSLDEYQTKVLKALQRSIAYYCQLEAMPFLNVQIGDAGIMENSASNNNPVRQWSYDKIELASSANGDRFLDQALLIIESLADRLPAWAASEACTINRELFINNATTLSRYINLQGSRRAYLAFRPYLYRAEDFYVRQIIGDAQFDELKAHLRAPELLTVQDKILIEKIKPVVAHFALFEALPELSITLSGAGMSVLNDSMAIRQRLAATQEELNSLASKEQELANNYLTSMRQFLDANADLYPLYKNSDHYQEPESGTDYELPNSEGSAFVV